MGRVFPIRRILTPKYFITSQKKEREALKEIKTWQICCVRVQDKGSRFFVISKNEYCDKVSTQIGRSSFIKLPHDITKSNMEQYVDSALLSLGSE